MKSQNVLQKILLKCHAYKEKQILKIKTKKIHLIKIKELDFHSRCNSTCKEIKEWHCKQHREIRFQKEF